MSIIDNVRIKQDWSEEGYQFEKDAPAEEKPELDAAGYFIGGTIDADFDGVLKQAILGHRTASNEIDRQKALDQAKGFLDHLRQTSNQRTLTSSELMKARRAVRFLDSNSHKPMQSLQPSPTGRWQECPRVEELSFAEIEKRVILDLETRSQASMDPGANGDGVLCYGYKVGDGPVIVGRDFSEIEKRAAEHYNFVGEKIYGEE